MPTAASIDWPVANMTDGVRPIADNAHPACTMTKLTRSRRPAADDRAARNTVVTAADLAAPEGVLKIAEGRADREGEVGASWTRALDSAFSPRRSRRQPARPRSSRVGSRAMAMAAAKVATTTSDIPQQCWTRGVSGPPHGSKSSGCCSAPTQCAGVNNNRFQIELDTIR